MWSCSKRLAYMVANLFAKESKKRRQKHDRTTMIKTRTTYVKHYSNIVFTSRTLPRRDHHGYTLG